jgi:hypothetical protein
MDTNISEEYTVCFSEMLIRTYLTTGCNIMEDHSMNMVCEIQGSHSWDVMACSLADIRCCQGRQEQHIPHKMSVRFLQSYVESHFK